MNIAEKIIANKKNTDNSRVQAHRIAVAAESETGVQIKGGRSKPYYKFTDGSSMTVDHILGSYNINWPKKMYRK